VRILSDVDGVIGDLMGRDGGGFTQWCREKGIRFDPNALANLRVTGEGRTLLLEFLRTPGAYMRYVNPIDGARESLARLASAGHDIRFVTSITEEPLQYASKNEWLERYFGHFEFETLTIPSREKHYHIGDYMIDDRADTIARFLSVGQRRGLFLFRQPWNFAYGDDGYWRHPVQFSDVCRTLNDINLNMQSPIMRNSDYVIPFVAHTDAWDDIEQRIMVDSAR
jgi:5'(3')-deoxyribonucleotidase